MLLLLAMVVLDIANTLSLGVHERTRELGLLRAVGATRGRLHSIIRGKPLVVAGLGTIGGHALGVFLA